MNSGGKDRLVSTLRWRSQCMWMKARSKGGCMTVSPIQKTNTNVMPCHELTMFWVYIEGYVSIYVEYHSF